MARKASSKPRVTNIPITKARINLGALVKRVHLNKEYFILEKDGIPIAGLMDIDEFEDYLELQDPKVRAHIRKSNEEYLAGKSRPAEELLRELREEQEGSSPNPGDLQRYDAVVCRSHHLAIRSPAHISCPTPLGGHGTLCRGPRYSPHRPLQSFTPPPHQEARREPTGGGSISAVAGPLPFPL